jgi:FKBP12-rapamycin complex-associated protein
LRKEVNNFLILDEVESDELKKIAKIVLDRINDKLQGTDFNRNTQLDIKSQVEKLIKQATSHENLSQSYLGWCPFW